MTELRAYCKINLGLRVLRRRADGFHDIETVMLPVRELCDTVWVKASTPPRPASRPVLPLDPVLEVSGLDIDCPPEQNICIRALRLMRCAFGIGEAAIRLNKAIPSGAGLGGGSADAAAVLRALNDEFALEQPGGELERLGAQLGSDVPFFVRERDEVLGGAQFCEGRGEVMTRAEVDLTGRWLVIAKPDVAISTAGAYAGVTPREGGPSLLEILKRPVEEWRELVRNDFEDSVLARHPEIGALKASLYGAGALYASMSGSGSAVFGIFEQRPENFENDIRSKNDNLFFHIEQL